ncbi:hypothetical protein Bbelb_433590, partial [Branchiostoma belcheri]
LRYGHYTCKPRSFVVKILEQKRMTGDCAFEDQWHMKEHLLTFCCDCARPVVAQAETLAWEDGKVIEYTYQVFVDGSELSLSQCTLLSRSSRGGVSFRKLPTDLGSYTRGLLDGTIIRPAHCCPGSRGVASGRLKLAD